LQLFTSDSFREAQWPQVVRLDSFILILDLQETDKQSAGLLQHDTNTFLLFLTWAFFLGICLRVLPHEILILLAQ